MPPQIGGDVLGGSPLGGAPEEDGTTGSFGFAGAIDATVDMSVTLWKVTRTTPTELGESNRAIDVVFGTPIRWIPSSETRYMPYRELPVEVPGEVEVNMHGEILVW